MKLQIKTFLFTFCVCLGFESSSFGIQGFKIVDLGLKQYSQSLPTSINNNNWVSGVYFESGEAKIFVIDEKRKMATRTERLPLYYVFLNNNNKVFGTLLYRESTPYWYYDESSPFRWENPFKYFQYFHFYYLYSPWGYSSYAFSHIGKNVWAVNDLDQILVMTAYSLEDIDNELYENTAWIYDNGKYVKISGDYFAAGYSINNKSEILGKYFTGSQLTGNRNSVYVVYDYCAQTIRHLEMPRSGTPFKINDRSQIIGSFINGKNLLSGYIQEWDGSCTEIENLYPYCFNNNGVVVGTYNYGDKKNQLAVWDNGVFIDINSVTDRVDDNGNVWTSLDFAEAINDLGCIVGQGSIDGKIHAFMLVPY